MELILGEPPHTTRSRCQFERVRTSSDGVSGLKFHDSQPFAGENTRKFHQTTPPTPVTVLHLAMIATVSGQSMYKWIHTEKKRDQCGDPGNSTPAVSMTNLTRFSENFSSNLSRFMNPLRSPAASNCNSCMAITG